MKNIIATPSRGHGKGEVQSAEAEKRTVEVDKEDVKMVIRKVKTANSKDWGTENAEEWVQRTVRR